MLSWRYLAGCLLGFAGVSGVVLFKEGATADFTGGVALVFVAAFCWACYTLAMKHVVTKTHPVVSFTIVSTYSTLFFVGLALVRSHPSQILSLGWPDRFWLAFSGLACISAAHSLYFHAVARLGVAVCASFVVVQPLATGVVSAGLFGERLNVPQMLMGALLLWGAYWVIRAGSRPTAQAVQECGGPIS